MGVDLKETKMREQVIKELCLVMHVVKQRFLMPAPIYYSHKILELMAAG